MREVSAKAKDIKNNITMRGFLRGNKLYEEDYILLESITKWPKSKIDRYFKGFLSFCESGNLHKKVILEVLNNILPASSAKELVI